MLSIVLTATREKDLHEAEKLIKSIRLCHERRVEILLFTSFETYKNTGLDGVFPIENPQFGFIDKVNTIVAVPREHILVMDCDTYMVEPIDDLIELLDQFDLAIAHAPNRWTYPVDKVPDSFPEFNTGVILLRKTTQVCHFLDSWLALYRQQLDKGLRIPSGDQASFREKLYLSNLRFATLTPEYNCRFTMGSMVSHKVKILHGRHENIETVALEVNQGPLNPWNDLPTKRFIKYDMYR